MAIKQRLLRAVEDTRRLLAQKNNIDFARANYLLSGGKVLCEQGLPENSAVLYVEVFDGLLLAFEQLFSARGRDAQEIKNLCGELLQEIENRIQQEERFKKEIFFLPYKISMWDSLESVWQVAVADKDHYLTYVMPLPYIYRNPDANGNKWHCEKFPQDIPTLDWQQVDLKAWHPDIIFIHNPYDGINTVTSVFEEYYSSNLKCCTDKLVYIPYFVLEEPDEWTKAQEDSNAHFFITPGVLNARWVIVQSESMRQAYIRVLARATNRDAAYWQNHVLGVGSPKLDKVQTSKREDFKLPRQWQEIIGECKVILYNLSVESLLRNSDKICDKMRHVFGFFKQRKDVVLWWRPHPLMKETIATMRPEIREEYERIERQYIEEAWGIYDDSPDLHRAICWTDAYYGDKSSVEFLYMQTGKPVMEQDVSIFAD